MFIQQVFLLPDRSVLSLCLCQIPCLLHPPGQASQAPMRSRTAGFTTKATHNASHNWQTLWQTVWQRRFTTFHHVSPLQTLIDHSFYFKFPALRSHAHQHALTITSSHSWERETVVGPGHSGEIQTEQVLRRDWRWQEMTGDDWRWYLYRCRFVWRCQGCCVRCVRCEAQMAVAFGIMLTSAAWRVARRNAKWLAQLVHDVEEIHRDISDISDMTQTWYRYDTSNM